MTTATPGPQRRNRSQQTTHVAIGIIIALLAALGAWVVIGTLNKPQPPAPQPPSFSVETIGTSVNGAAIEAYRFGSGTKRYLVVGGIHGNEYGVDVGSALVSRLKSDPSLVPSDTEIDVIPLANPDGRAADTRANARGVDLNRNFPSKNWSSKLAKGDRTKLSGGASAGSEPETQALIKYLDRGFSGVLSLHSKGGIVDYDGPGGDVVAKRVSARIGLPISHVAYQPSVRGSMGIYVPEKYSLPVITLELKSSELSAEVLGGVLAFASPN